MQTPAFLEELNIYSVIEMDNGPVWTQSTGSDYPYIAKLYESTGIAPTQTGITRRDSHIYSISGQRLAAPAKGVNIIGGKKVMVK